MTKSNVGKLVGAMSLFGGGAIIGAAMQEEIRNRSERKRQKEDAAEKRLREIEKRLWLTEEELREKDSVIDRLTKRLESTETKNK